MICLSSNYRHQCTDKSANPILATQASPGMGKSSLMDAICSLTEAQVRKLSPAAATDEFCANVATSIRIPVDYNDIQAPSEVDVKHPKTGLALRILHSFVIACSFRSDLRFATFDHILFDTDVVCFYILPT
jgi:hypothetical protein